MSAKFQYKAIPPSTPTIYLDGRIAVHPGDCLAIVKTLADNSIDACVCDPPYALVSISKRFGADSAAPCKPGKTGAYQRASAGFMGKKWDTGETAFAVEFWHEVLRVLKPGAHVVAFGGTRTYHRLAVAIEDAGFECRDAVMWHYGTGFPKSHSVDKAIDRAGGISPRDQAVLLKAKREGAGLSREDLAAKVGCSPASVGNWEDGRARAAGLAVEWLVPSDDYRLRLADILGYSADERRIVGVSTDRRGDETVYGVGHSGTLRSGGNTDAAREWEGWGTALKPATEIIFVGRKPLSEGTIAANVLRWGTGAINVDACRVGTEGATKRSHQESYGPEGRADHGGGQNWRTGHEIVSLPLGRWPANLVHSGEPEVLAAFPESKGQQGDLNSSSARPSKTCFGDMAAPLPHPARNDSGSAARFFYSAKASKHDRMGSKHPTVKPVKLMQWLCRLVTPPGGTILDPFSGTGTTGAAAYREGFNAILCEREAEYLADIDRRMKLLPDQIASESTKAKVKVKPVDDEPQLFDEERLAA